MIILIGGAGSVGKTLMAQNLLENYSIPYLSMDHLKMGLIKGLKDCPISAEDDDDKIISFMWPVVRSIITTNIENNQNLIIEGCYFPFNFMTCFTDFYKSNIISFFIVMSREYIEKNFNNILTKRNIIEKRLENEHRSMQKIINENNLIKFSCDKNNIKYFEISTDYKKDINKVYSWIDKEIQNKK